MFKLLKTVFISEKAPHCDAMPEQDSGRDRLTRTELARLFASELGYLNRSMSPF